MRSLITGSVLTVRNYPRTPESETKIVVAMSIHTQLLPLFLVVGCVPLLEMKSMADDGDTG